MQISYLKRNIKPFYLYLLNVILINLLILEINNHNAFPKIKSRLENLAKDLIFKKENLEYNFAFDKVGFLKELFDENFLSARRHSTVTEYIGVNKEDLLTFTHNIISDYKISKIPDIKNYLENQMEDVFYANNNDLICEKIVFQGGVNESNFLVLLGESSADKKSSNWLIISVRGFSFRDGVTVKEDEDKKYIFGIFSYNKTSYTTVLTNVAQDKIDIYNKFFEYSALEKAMDFFKISDNLEKKN